MPPCTPAGNGGGITKLLHDAILARPPPRPLEGGNHHGRNCRSSPLLFQRCLLPRSTAGASRLSLDACWPLAISSLSRPEDGMEA
nr:hypothetical protein Itr_chr10CG18750 [Ipomoea trifida]